MHRDSASLPCLSRVLSDLTLLLRWSGISLPLFHSFIHLFVFLKFIVCLILCLFFHGKKNFQSLGFNLVFYFLDLSDIAFPTMAAPPARARADYDYLIKLLLIGDSGTILLFYPSTFLFFCVIYFGITKFTMSSCFFISLWMDYCLGFGLCNFQVRFNLCYSS